ncbi:MAG: hypothetical protein LBQ50_08390 [Planctomycetaceae bacterium]|jgi:hypothetical protein|nr:hypothetical protein [Planctomycetaceae bacterium]
MRQTIMLIIVFFVVFFIGFLSGSFWQTLLQNQRQVLVIDSSVAPVTSPTAETVKPNKLTEEEQITQALTDSDFKRVHDFLIRESPMQMNLEKENK